MSPIADMLDSLGVGLIAYDAEDRALLWNATALRLFPEHDGHIHVGEAYSDNLRRFYQGRLDPHEMAHIEHYIASGVARHRAQTMPFEFQHRGQWLRAASLPVPGVGRVRMWMPILPPQDTEILLRRMADSGRESSSGAIYHIADGLMVRGPDGKILSLNQRFAELYGLRSEVEAVGRDFRDILTRLWDGSPDGEAAMLAWTDNSKFRGAPFELPLPGDRWVRVRELHALDGCGVSTHVDITDLHRLQRATAAAQSRAEALAASLREEIEERRRAEARTISVARLASLGEMATGLAHELNQPLAVMALAADLTALELEKRGEAAIPVALGQMTCIAENAVRARDIVDHLRVIGRSEDSSAPARPLALARAVQGALVLTRTALQALHIEIEVRLPDGLPTVLGHLVPLEQAIMNLLLNARDAITERRVAAGRIVMVAEQRGDQVALTISDNGGGIPAAVMAKLFEPFFTTKPPGKGTGLGLSICHATLQAMGGRVEACNGAEGATFTLTLPISDTGTAFASV